MAFLPTHPGNSPVHALPAHVKLVALLGFMLAVVASPGDRVWPYVVHLALLLGVVAVARLPLGHLARGLVIETPMVLFALLLPFIATGPTTVVLGVTVSTAGLWGAWALLARATLGVLAALTLAATTDPPQLLAGLHHLRLPRPMVEILGFMLRYVHVIGAEWTRMRIAQEARGYVPSVAGWPVLARSVGTLFLRSYERGERVHLAMLSRGGPGTMVYRGTRAPLAHWLQAGVVPALAALVSGLARVA